MKLVLSFVLALGLIGSAQAQSSETPKQSNQESKQQNTQKEVPHTKPAPRSSNPEDAHTSTTGAADKKTFQAGKKADDTAGCSTPTDAKSAGVDTSSDSPTRKRSDGRRTVCTTAGSEGVGAVDKSKKKKQTPPRSATDPGSTSAEPR